MNILYGVPSEGMGHATRSKVIIDHLLKKHNVQIVTSDRAFTFLSKYFPDRVHRIDGFHLAYKNAALSFGDTVFNLLKNAPKNLLRNFQQYMNIVNNFEIDLVISDFESFTHFYAKIQKKPLISIDNMQVIDRCSLDISVPHDEKLNHALAKSIISGKVFHADSYLITSFFRPPIRKKYTNYIPSIIREEIVSAKRTVEDHIVVYQTSTSQKNLVSLLQALPNERFFVYGFHTEEQHGNVYLKQFSEVEFVHHLASAKAVLSNGGFSLLSEAVYLHKPIFSVPIKNQFEQFVNASYVEKLGFGRHFEKFTSDNLKAFLFDLKLFQASLKHYTQKGNEEAFESIDREIDRVMS